jgi:hypothetical protein
MSSSFVPLPSLLFLRAFMEDEMMDVLFLPLPSLHRYIPAEPLVASHEPTSVIPATDSESGSSASCSTAKHAHDAAQNR